MTRTIAQTVPKFTRRLAMTYEEFTKTAKTALYTRLAVADDDAIAEQERKLLEYAKANGYTQYVCYRDNGKSGANQNRPELQDMLLDVESGVIETVIVQDLARLSRDCLQLDELVNLLTANDVLLISVADGGVVNGVE